MQNLIETGRESDLTVIYDAFKEQLVKLGSSVYGCFCLTQLAAGLSMKEKEDLLIRLSEHTESLIETKNGCFLINKMIKSGMSREIAKVFKLKIDNMWDGETQKKNVKRIRSGLASILNLM